MKHYLILLKASQTETKNSIDNLIVWFLWKVSKYEPIPVKNKHTSVIDRQDYMLSAPLTWYFHRVSSKELTSVRDV